MIARGSITQKACARREKNEMPEMRKLECQIAQRVLSGGRKEPEIQRDQRMQRVRGRVEVLGECPCCGQDALVGRRCPRCGFCEMCG